jgi:SAM-dependent methyltransferase
MRLLDRLHGDYVHSRRVRVLRDELVALLPRGARVLDVGAGDGLLSSLLAAARPDLTLSGIDTLVREETKIPVTRFDGEHIPFEAKSFDVVLFVDVLHHTDDPMVLLREALRVARHSILIKDHRLEGAFAKPTLTFMDWMGNARHGVALPNNYWPERRWRAAFEDLRLVVTGWNSDLGLYPWVADLVFGRSLHFVARLEPRGADV